MEALRYQGAEVVAEELEALRQRIIANIDAAGQRASGATANSLTPEVTEGSVGITGILWGRSFFSTLEKGSRPWKRQYIRPPKFFIDLMAEWAARKGISAPAGGIAYNIMTKGSKLYRTGGRTDIYSNEIPATIDRIASRLAGIFDVAIDESITKK